MNEQITDMHSLNIRLQQTYLFLSNHIDFDYVDCLTTIWLSIKVLNLGQTFNKFDVAFIPFDQTRGVVRKKYTAVLEYVIYYKEIVDRWKL